MGKRNENSDLKKIKLERSQRLSKRSGKQKILPKETQSKLSTGQSIGSTSATLCRSE